MLRTSGKAAYGRLVEAFKIVSPRTLRPAHKSHTDRLVLLQAAELGEDALASTALQRLLALADPGLVPQGTSRRASAAMVSDIGRHDGGLEAIAVLPDGRVVSGGRGGRMRVWDPAAPGAGPVELGGSGGDDFWVLWVSAVAVLQDGRVVSGAAYTGEGLTPSAQCGCGIRRRPRRNRSSWARHDDRVRSVAVLRDGRVVSGDHAGRLLMWDWAAPEAGPVELSRHGGWVARLRRLGAARAREHPRGRRADALVDRGLARGAERPLPHGPAVVGRLALHGRA